MECAAAGILVVTRLPIYYLAAGGPVSLKMDHANVAPGVSWRRGCVEDGVVRFVGFKARQANVAFSGVYLT